MKIVAVVADPIINRPAKSTAVLGSLNGSGRGKTIPCEDLRPTIFHEGITYEYCGTMDGVGQYKQADELRELEAEQSDRQGW